MNRRMNEALDRYITGNYGENQFKGQCEECDLETDYICPNCKARIDAETKKERDAEYRQRGFGFW